ncbi:CbtA family protein [Streptomyces neyagawaensis]|uniref:CbtA family protein n=1 Tax=Streptomyces neyagawaensis TaxID=42238 RepID=UPI0006E3820C|nr:CbtA family protein [Streptomyces neyagawaensis]MCL6734827.1 CbtA family protein [Streptomyces neyagawaensis]MDE1686507.1 CbtA family protein [Streptomyces neyagawaensis]
MNSALVRALLVRGMLAGLLAAVPALLFAYFVGEGPVDAAIAFESANSHEHGEELVSRSVQSTAGLATGMLVFGVAVGGIAALAFCFALGRVGRFSARATAALTALAAFLLVYLVPTLKYPANPPAVGDPDTLARRTALFFLMIALSVLLGSAAVILGRRVAPLWGNWNASVTAGLAFTAAVAVAMVFLPSGDNIPKGFPAADLWEFRLASIGIQAVLWAGFGLAFGYLAERVLAPRPLTHRVPTPVA